MQSPLIIIHLNIYPVVFAPDYDGFPAGRAGQSFGKSSTTSAFARVRSLLAGNVPANVLRKTAWNCL